MGEIYDLRLVLNYPAKNLAFGSTDRRNMRILQANIKFYLENNNLDKALELKNRGLNIIKNGRQIYDKEEVK